jgi:fructokinase
LKRVGVDLGGTKIQGVVLAEDGRVLESQRVPTPSGDYQATVSALVALVRSLEANHGESGPLRVGIGTPGIWQASAGRMKNCNSTWLNGQPLITDLCDLLGREIRAANDADCFALSEARSGAGAGYASVFGVILGTGVGGGLVFNGKLHNGPNGLSGEWGHTPLPYFGVRAETNLTARTNVQINAEARAQNAVLDGLESRLDVRGCYCGRLGCVETYLSGPGLKRSYAELWGEPRAPEAIASASDEKADLTLSLYSRMLARSLAQIINIVDPGVIVLGGGLSKVDRLYAPVNRLLAEYVFSGECVTVVKPPVWGAQSGVLGAAGLWSAGQ